jgi:hypothetical protein
VDLAESERRFHDLHSDAMARLELVTLEFSLVNRRPCIEVDPIRILDVAFGRHSSTGAGGVI